MLVFSSETCEASREDFYLLSVRTHPTHHTPHTQEPEPIPGSDLKMKER